MKIYAIDHVQLAMPAGEEEKARAFYNEVLGIEETPIGNRIELMEKNKIRQQRCGKGST